MRYYFVNCKVCGEMHTTKEIELLNVEEDQYGHDVATYLCPTSPLGDPTQATVHAG